MYVYEQAKSASVRPLDGYDSDRHIEAEGNNKSRALGELKRGKHQCSTKRGRESAKS